MVHCRPNSCAVCAEPSTFKEGLHRLWETLSPVIASEDWGLWHHKHPQVCSNLLRVGKWVDVVYFYDYKINIVVLLNIWDERCKTQNGKSNYIQSYNSSNVLLLNSLVYFLSLASDFGAGSQEMNIMGLWCLNWLHMLLYTEAMPYNFLKRWKGVCVWERERKRENIYKNI